MRVCDEHLGRVWRYSRLLSRHLSLSWNIKWQIREPTMGATRARDGPKPSVLGVLHVSYETNRSSLDHESNISRSFQTALHLTGNVKPAPHDNNALLHRPRGTSTLQYSVFESFEDNAA